MSAKSDMEKYLGVEATPLTPKLPVRSSNKIWSLYEEYARLVEESAYSPSSKVIYTYFAECFVRWLDGDFEIASHVG